MSRCDLTTEASSQNDVVSLNVASYDDEHYVYEFHEEKTENGVYHHGFLPWYDVVIDLCYQMDALQTKRNVVRDDLQSTCVFVENLKVPHCYEFARLSYARGFSALLDDFESLSFDMDSFSSRVAYHESMLKMHGDDATSIWSSKHLESFIEMYASRLELIIDELKKRKVDGKDLLGQSQQVNRPCGF